MLLTGFPTNRFAGLYLSFYINVASGAAVVLVATGIFVLVFLFPPAKGLLWRFMRRTSAKSTKGLQ
jgi:hypothetical protein